MLTRTLTLALALAAALAAPARAQQYLGAIPTNGYGQNTGNPFGLAWGPNGQLYVSLSGTASFVNPQSFNNNVVVRIDPATDTVVGVVQAGLFPEEIAFAHPAGGSEIGLVSNSTDGTVTIFDVATDATLATVTLPGGFFGAFPFGVAANANDTTAYVGVGDGSQALRAIDLDPSSATQYQYVASGDLALSSGGGGRFLRVGADFLVPTTTYSPTFSGSTAHLERAPLPSSANPQVSVTLASDSTFTTYPSAQDTVLAPDGLVYVAGYDSGRRIIGFDPASGSLVRAIPSGTTKGGHTGLALSPDGKVLVVCDVASDEVAFLDVARGTQLSMVKTTNLGFGYFQPNDAIFSPDGSKVYVTCQGSEAVLVFAAPAAPTPYSPTLGFTVTPTAAPLGASVTLSSIGAGPNDFVAIFADGSDWAIDLGTGILHVTLAASTLATATGTDASVTVTAPADPAWYGVNFLCQAIAVDLNNGILRFSDEIPVILQ